MFSFPFWNLQRLYHFSLDAVHCLSYRRPLSLLPPSTISTTPQTPWVISSQNFRIFLDRLLSFSSAQIATNQKSEDPYPPSQRSAEDIAFAVARYLCHRPIADKYKGLQKQQRQQRLKASLSKAATAAPENRLRQLTFDNCC
ncbi:hypothetical protein Adt_02128 [Abeliophyllum distichum]|uniref:Uncharacterized protein n=1 Tax=Abeliophyllum distichum TaxID=126358 RepID=A0ABD1VV39_9LAMI